MLQLDIAVERMDQYACKIPTAPGKSIFSLRLPTYLIIFIVNIDLYVNI